MCSARLREGVRARVRVHVCVRACACVHVRARVRKCGFPVHLQQAVRARRVSGKPCKEAAHVALIQEGLHAVHLCYGVEQGEGEIAGSTVRPRTPISGSSPLSRTKNLLNQPRRPVAGDHKQCQLPSRRRPFLGLSADVDDLHACSLLRSAAGAVQLRV